MLVFVKGRKLEDTKKNLRSGDKNQQQTQPTFDAELEIQNHATFVEVDREFIKIVAGGHQDSAPKHMGGHVLNKYSCVESPGFKTKPGKFMLTGSQFALCPAFNDPPE